MRTLGGSALLTKKKLPSKARIAVVCSSAKLEPADDSQASSKVSTIISAATLGVLTGLVVVFFKVATSLVQDLTYSTWLTDSIFTYRPEWDGGILIALVPALGGIMVSVFSLLSGGLGVGLPGIVSSADAKQPLNGTGQAARLAAAITTLGTGNSLGPEGPSVEIGMSLSRLIAAQTDWSVQRQQQFLSNGAAAGIAAGFNAPLTSVFFVVEIVQPLQSKGPDALSRFNVVSLLTCAVFSTLTARTLLDEKLAFIPADYDLRSPFVELPLYLGLGALSGVIAYCLKEGVSFSRKLFEGKVPNLEFTARVPFYLRPALAGLICGTVGLFYPQVLFYGYDTLNTLLGNENELPGVYLFFLSWLKLVLTSICAGSGLIGGLFAPALFLGATAGAAYQRAILSLVDSAAASLVAYQLSIGVDPGSWGVLDRLLVADSPAYAMVGGASVLAAYFDAPLTSILLLFELTHDFDIVLPLMASTGISFLVSSAMTSSTTTSTTPCISSSCDVTPEEGEGEEEEQRAAEETPPPSPTRIDGALMTSPLLLPGITDLSTAAKLTLDRQQSVVLVTSSQESQEGDDDGEAEAADGGDVTWVMEPVGGEGAQRLRIVGATELSTIVAELSQQRKTGERPGGVRQTMTLRDVCQPAPSIPYEASSLELALQRTTVSPSGCLLVVSDRNELMGCVTGDTVASAVEIDWVEREDQARAADAG